MTLRTLAALGLACTALLTGCATDHTTDAAKPPHPAAPSTPSRAATTAGTVSTGTATAGTDSTGTATAGTAPAATAPAGTSAARPLFHRAPELDLDETLAGRQEPMTGNASFTFTKGRKGDTLILAVRCQGEGRVEVTVRPVHVAFALRCPADRADTVYHQVRVTGTARGGTASVQAPSTVRWSMTVGRTRS
ncbi:hypothetical protein ABZX39_06170 [Streptomyces collinus]|uniref:hypothetical protein n=1 Tax=Streptomyces collinus TaxID=42684 RepID=UPI0033B88B6E